VNVLILNGSPKKKGGASNFFANVFRLMLLGCKTSYESLQNKNNYAKILEQLRDIDALVITVPLYVDAIPSHVQEFLTQAQCYCKQNNCHFTLYVISNNGFIEGIQNKVHLQMYRCWCERTSITWGGGIGIGGGVMLHVLSIVYPIIFTIYILNIVVNLINGNVISGEMWIPLLKNVLIYLFLNSGMIYCMIRLASHLRKQETTKNRYTRVMVPSLLFIVCADIFMFLTSLFNGRFIFSLLKRDRYEYKSEK
jgi:hypothetical protein